MEPRPSSSSSSSILLSLLGLFLPVGLLQSATTGVVGGGGGGGELQMLVNLVLLGLVAPLAHRVVNELIALAKAQFYVQATFGDEDASYAWLILWLTKQPTWRDTRTIHISTLSSGIEDGPALMLTSPTYTSHKSCIYVQPEAGVKYSLWFRGSRVTFWVGSSSTGSSGGGFYGGIGSSVFGSRGDVGDGMGGGGGRGVARRDGTGTLVLRVYTSQGQQVIADLLKEAESAYRSLEMGTISVYRAQSSLWGTCDWTSVGQKRSRPFSSVILERGVANRLVADVKEFMDSSDWYRRRGIPFRRGYLMYGPPGTGKTSFVAALAAELELDIYLLSLSGGSGLDDTSLARLLATVPKRSILLVEDIDATQRSFAGRKATPPSSTAASTSSTAGDDSNKPDSITTSEVGSDSSSSSSSGSDSSPGGARDRKITLAGLLAALDGIEASEGRILFATTNHREDLDPALCRPGRMDVHVEFGLASRYQAKELFKKFYPDDECAGDDNGSVGLAMGGGLPGDEGKVPPATSSGEARDSSSSTRGGPGPLPSDTDSNAKAERDLEEAVDIDSLAARFSELIPEKTFTMAMLQEYLMKFKKDPRGACAEEEVNAFVQRVRSGRR